MASFFLGNFGIWKKAGRKFCLFFIKTHGNKCEIQLASEEENIYRALEMGILGLHSCKSVTYSKPALTNFCF